MKAISSQRKQLYRLFGYNKETEAVHIKKVTGDPAKTSAADLTIIQAKDLIGSLTKNWAYFDKDNRQHSTILSLCHQVGWVQAANPKYVDLTKLSTWLKSFRSPVQKPLQSMDKTELSKVIFALQQMLNKRYK